VFQFYEGGGPDVSILSFGEVDRDGNVNVSRFSGMLPGCGGFVNIVHGVRRLMFCGTLTTGGLEETVRPDGLAVQAEGRIRRFVEAVEQITFNGRRGLEAGKQVEYVTDRGVFRLAPEGLVLTEVAPGIDIERGIRAQIGFPIHIDPQLAPLPLHLFGTAPVVATGPQPIAAAG
jgi:acyl CoA:acetate/3-ketoacid CoA transferase